MLQINLSYNFSSIELKLFLEKIKQYEIGVYEIILNMYRHTFKNKKELKDAIYNYFNHHYKTKTIQKYGIISLWDIRNITDMSSIFSIKDTVFVEFKNNVGYVESKDEVDL